MDIKKIPEDYNEGIGKYFNFRKEYEGRGGLLKINRFLPIRVKHKLLGTIYIISRLMSIFIIIGTKHSISQKSQHYDMLVSRPLSRGLIPCCQSSFPDDPDVLNGTE